MPKHETRNRFCHKTWEVNIVWWRNLATLCNITKEIFSSQNSIKKCRLETRPKPFLIFKESSKKQSQEVCVLIWTNFDSFANTYLILLTCFKSFIFLEVVHIFEQTEKGLKLVFRQQFLWNLLIIFFFFFDMT